MDLLDRLLGHDEWTTAELLRCCEGLTDEQLDRPFGIGYRSVRATLDHLIHNAEVWSALMAGDPDPAGPRVRDRSIAGLAGRHVRASARLAEVARAVALRDGWDERWLDVLEDPPVEQTYGGTIAHVITHSMHHRAQVLYMLKTLGAGPLPEGDALSWERRIRPF